MSTGETNERHFLFYVHHGDGDLPMTEYVFKGENYCCAECTIYPLTGISPGRVGWEWDAKVVLEIIAAAMKIDVEKTHSDVFPQVLAEDVQGKCAYCGFRI